MILLGELVVVDPIDHGQVGVSARGGDQDALGAGLQVLRRLLALGEPAGALHDDVDAQLTPRKLLGIRLGQHRDVQTIGLEMPVGHRDLAREAPVHAVVFQQKSVHFGRPEIVDRHEIEVLAASLQERPEGEPADPAESIDGDTRISHFSAYLYFLTIRSRAAAATASGVMPKCL